MKKFNIHDWQAKQTKQRLAENIKKDKTVKHRVKILNIFMIKILLWVN